MSLQQNKALFLDRDGVVNIDHDSPQLLKEDLVYVSVRDTEKPEDDFMARNQILF